MDSSKLVVSSENVKKCTRGLRGGHLTRSKECTPTFDAKTDQRQTKTDFCAFFVRFSHENQLHGWPAFRTFLIILKVVF